MERVGQFAVAGMRLGGSASSEASRGESRMPGGEIHGERAGNPSYGGVAIPGGRRGPNNRGCWNTRESPKGSEKHTDRQTVSIARKDKQTVSNNRHIYIHTHKQHAIG